MFQSALCRKGFVEKCFKFYLAITWAEVGEVQLIGLDLLQKTTEKISQINDRLKAARDRQKSYADKRKPLEFSVGDYVLLKVWHWKGVVCFGKKGKLAPRFVGPFEIVEKFIQILYRVDGSDFVDIYCDLWFIVINNPFLKIGWIRVPSICEIIGSDGYAYPVFVRLLDRMDTPT
nr:putative reverse transcriptase domain-containing protein [Tanacetum cinerariifolium]